MQRISCILTAFLLSCPGFSQTGDLKAMECFNLGTYKVVKKDFKAAIVEFNEAIRRDSLFLQAYENRGVAKYYLNDFTGAIEDYNKALDINPDDYNTFGRRGYARFQLNDFKTAVADFSEALKGNQNDAGFLTIRGQAKYKLLDYQGAINDFNKVIKSWSFTKQQKSKAFYWRGLVKIDMGRKEEGCTDLRKAARSGYEMAVELSDMLFCK
ncbi:MAG TPA: tetratricopeptide repeat protein [Bacteroidales bacterium]|nr:tetratricopeptide repeat protein [Bacteroidales bacterium]HOX73804.1 tetratricopeptide repeat protein [Bacteroidales bacterium]HPM88027.1 tetratricopeptide repeat protein [Bacteroidales bacterium]HQM69191.1 tetratricopeptide repeat protein [Bacteroidales bacterium]